MQTHLHSVLTVVMLFFFGLVSPGPNFLVVAQTALNFGRAETSYIVRCAEPLITTMGL
jgi:threonine/homoserine/homoserine lactone efflux protein